MNLTPLLLKSLGQIESAEPVSVISFTSSNKKVPLFNQKKVIPSSSAAEKKLPDLFQKQLRAVRKVIVSPNFQKSLLKNGKDITEVKFSLKGETANWTICYPARELSEA